MRWAFPHGELGTWLALGAVTERSVRVWLRAPGNPSEIARLRLDGRVAAQARLAPDPAHDHIAVADLVLDSPAPNAPFTVEAAGLTRRGRLAPALGTRAAFSFALGSCHYPFAVGPDGALIERAATRIYPAMARALRARDSRFLLLVGDQVYADVLRPIDVRSALRQRYATEGRLPPLADVVDAYRHVYRGYFNQPGLRALQEGWPTHLMWDDHEVFDSWGGGHGDRLDRRIMEGAAQAYREYQHWRNPNTRVDDAAPYDYSFWYGDVGFLVLDVRGVRDTAAGVVLGARQWHDLDTFLATADQRGCPTVFIVASVPVVHFSPALLALGGRIPGSHQSGVRERWAQPALRAERDRLLDRLFAWQTAGPTRQAILLSGDVHAGAAFRVRRPRRPGTIVQWTSSALTTPLSPFLLAANTLGTALVQVGEWRYRITRQALVPRNNFGLIDVTPIPSGGHLVDLRLCVYQPKRDIVAVAARVVARPGA